VIRFSAFTRAVIQGHVESVRHDYRRHELTEWEIGQCVELVLRLLRGADVGCMRGEDTEDNISARLVRSWESRFSKSNTNSLLTRLPKQFPPWSQRLT
jgi:hypothetical protein